ncbi:hypothetical protein BP6252_12895 [Coleophoma cylindrospora]|uniref:MARVEL domain-containing protein n=1 Tax=Coleophoma cylindrospora TaxID=1849047 RepID=A0A3D8QDV7_9HELO|nr:hypothetical protein BP6252_12895 [Coleophoma cylindrospora]
MALALGFAPIRIVQGLFAVIVLGLTAYDVSSWSYYSTWSPSSINYLLFVSIWTLLALAYLVITPGRYEVAAHKYGILAAEALTALFWFAGWIAVAALLGVYIFPSLVLS